jgi:subtilisin family serine protease
MNLELPPLSFPPPQIAGRRRERRGFVTPPAIPAEQRRAIALNIQRTFIDVTRAVRTLSPEAKRAIFLKLTHDRPITKADLAGTGLSVLGPSGENSTLVVPKDPGDLSKLAARLANFAGGTEAGRPQGTELSTNVKEVFLGMPHDRLSEQFAANYEQAVQSEFVKYEIEVTSFKTTERGARGEVESIISEIRSELAGGVHGRIYEHEIYGRGARILLSTTGTKLKDFVEAPRWLRKIVLFDERPKFETFHTVLEEFNVQNVVLDAPNRDAETICIIDSGVAAKNPFLEKVLRTDISRSFISGFSPLEDAQGHGSGVASLAAYYPFDISRGATNQGGAFIVSARITNDDGQLDHPITDDIEGDRARESRLLSRVLRDIVTHYHPLGIRIYVLAFQILGHIWSKAARKIVPRNAWLARTIDQLSREFDVVFVAISGNVNAQDIRDLLREKPHPLYLNLPLAKIHDPGQAALAVTCGSIAHSATVIASPHHAIALVDQPSPFSRSGPGFGDSIKPDFVERGGNLVHDTQLDIVLANAGTNVLMASGRLTPAIQNTNGTSFAAPRVAHHLALIGRDLRSAGIAASAPLLRAVLACSSDLPAAVPALSSDESRSLLGYGLPNGFSATECQNHSVLLYWQGNVDADCNVIFRIHVPAELSTSGRGPKRIVIAVAFAPPVQTWGVEEYLGAEMKFRLYRGDRSYQDIEASLQLDDGEENLASKVTADDMVGEPGITARSSGTLQRATFAWQDHDPAYSADDYTLAISLFGASWIKPGVLVPMAVTTRIEDRTSRFQELYSRVKARVQARART